MKKNLHLNPQAARDALARVRLLPVRAWTYLTGLPHTHEPPRRPWSVNRHLLVFFGVAGLALGLTTWSTQTLVGIALGMPV